MVTAEWAIALPAVILTASVLFGAIGIVLERARLDQAAADAVRMMGLGVTSAEAITHAERVIGGRLEATVSVDSAASLVCVELVRGHASRGVMTLVEAVGKACGLWLEQP